MSTPAVVPHFRPAGSWPQLRWTFGAGFGNPSPVIGLPAAAAAPEGAAAVTRPSDPPLHAASRSVALAPTTRRKILGFDIVPPRVRETGANPVAGGASRTEEGATGQPKPAAPEAYGGDDEDDRAANGFRRDSSGGGRDRGRSVFDDRADAVADHYRTRRAPIWRTRDGRGGHRLAAL